MTVKRRLALQAVIILLAVGWCVSCSTAVAQEPARSYVQLVHVDSVYQIVCYQRRKMEQPAPNLAPLSCVKY